MNGVLGRICVHICQTRPGEPLGGSEMKKLPSYKFMPCTFGKVSQTLAPCFGSQRKTHSWISKAQLFMSNNVTIKFVWYIYSSDFVDRLIRIHINIVHVINDTKSPRKMVTCVYHNEVYGVAKVVALLYSTKWLVVFRSQATRIWRVWHS